MLTLTVKQIKELAEFSGLVLDKSASYDEFELDTEITIRDCPAGGVKDDEGTVRHYTHVAYCTDYPEEGCVPLGDELKPVACIECSAIGEAACADHGAAPNDQIQGRP